MRATMSGNKRTGPFIVLTSVLDAEARPASVTRSHGEAFERLLPATGAHDIAGVDLVELPIHHAAHLALRKHLGLGEDQAGIYDVFPLAPTLDPAVRKAAAQFLAAEALWNLDAQGIFGRQVLSVKLDLPKGWDRDPKAVHQKLVEAGALELSPEAVETYKAIKSAFSAT
ncbi:MAG: hypothetical protein JWN48_4642 [Myxococcaceae bacterium]|nr:hypothetical protein [Myxococcaceae bacterium]